MGVSTSTQPNIKVAAASAPPGTTDEALPDLIPDVEWVILPDMFEVPASWKQFGARLRARFSRTTSSH